MSMCFFLNEWRDMGCYMEYCSFNSDENIHVLEEQAPCVKNPDMKCPYYISRIKAKKIIRDYVVHAKFNLENAKEVIKENYKRFDCGIYNTYNITGDPTYTIYENEELRINGCEYYAYLEVFGLEEEDFEELKNYYNILVDKYEEELRGKVIWQTE